MEKHQIILEGQHINYDIVYKQMKSIRMKVEAGHLIVSAPYCTPLSYIEDCIRQYKGKLLSQIDNYEAYALYQDNGYVDIFHKRYSICLRDVGMNKCQIHDQQLYVYHGHIEQCVESYLKQVLYNYILERVIGYLAYDFDLEMPDIEIKKYKGRWGSCYYKENKITFHLSLVHLEKDLIDYVIVHELTHFIQANHSSLFYQELEKRMPDYKQRQRRLKEKHV